jgi:hypothetical protein
MFLIMKRKATHLISICVAVDMADMGVLLVTCRPTKQPPAKNAPPRLLEVHESRASVAIRHTSPACHPLIMAFRIRSHSSMVSSIAEMLKQEHANKQRAANYLMLRRREIFGRTRFMMALRSRNH